MVCYRLGGVPTAKEYTPILELHFTSPGGATPKVEHQPGPNRSKKESIFTAEIFWCIPGTAAFPCP